MNSYEFPGQGGHGFDKPVVDPDADLAIKEEERLLREKAEGVDPKEVKREMDSAIRDMEAGLKRADDTDHDFDKPVVDPLAVKEAEEEMGFTLKKEELKLGIEAGRAQEAARKKAYEDALAGIRGDTHKSETYVNHTIEELKKIREEQRRQQETREETV